MSELTDRMHTCLEHIKATRPSELLYMDAANLLAEAAFELQRWEESAKSWTPTETRVPIEKPQSGPPAYWVGDDLQPIPNQPISKNACPNCDSRTTKIVRAAGRKIELECAVCSFRWQH